MHIVDEPTRTVPPAAAPSPSDHVRIFLYGPYSLLVYRESPGLAAKRHALVCREPLVRSPRGAQTLSSYR